MFYLIKSEYAIFFNSDVTKIERSAFFFGGGGGGGTPGIIVTAEAGPKKRYIDAIML